MWTSAKSLIGVIVLLACAARRWAVALACEAATWVAGDRRSIGSTGTIRRGRAALLALAAIAILATLYVWRDVPGNWWSAMRGERPLLAVKSWFLHLSEVSMDRIIKSDADLVVTDYQRADDKSGPSGAPFTKGELARMKKRADGRERLVVSYFSIGEAESYRYYWRSEWEPGDPGWYVAENCAWPKNYMVRFWHDGWKDIIYRGKNSYLKRIIEGGFDGVYLDRTDIYEQLLKERPTAAEDMIDFVAELAATARRLKPGFLIIGQNAEGLLAHQRYRAILDGLGKEDLLYGMQGTGKRNPARETASALVGIRALQWEWKPIFAVEYLSDPKQIEDTRRELQGLGLVPTFAHRSLDGLDPMLPRGPKTIQYGTPEWISTNCKDKPHW